MAAAMTASSTFTGVKIQARARVQQTQRVRVVVCAQAQSQNSRRQALGFAAAALAIALVPSAKADLVADLLAKSESNKALNDKKRLATSYSNLQRSRSVQDGSCSFPENFLGCDVGSYAGDVAFIADDAKLECEGKDAGKCASKINIPKDLKFR